MEIVGVCEGVWGVTVPEHIIKECNTLSSSPTQPITAKPLDLAEKAS